MTTTSQNCSKKKINLNNDNNKSAAVAQEQKATMLTNENKFREKLSS